MKKSDDKKDPEAFTVTNLDDECLVIKDNHQDCEHRIQITDSNEKIMKLQLQLQNILEYMETSEMKEAFNEEGSG